MILRDQSLIVCGTVFIRLMSPVRIFHSKKILVKNILRKIHGLCAKSFINSEKDCYIVRLYDGIGTMFVNTSYAN